MDRRYLLFLLIAATIWLGWIKVMQVKYPPRPQQKKLQQAAKENPGDAKKDGKPAEKELQPGEEKAGEAKSAPEMKAADPKDQEEKAEAQGPEAKPEPKLETGLALGRLHEPSDKGTPEYFLYAEFTNRDAVVTNLTLNHYLDEERKNRFQLLGHRGPGSFLITKIERLGNREDRKSEASGLDHRNWEVISRSPEKIAFRNTAFGGQLAVVKTYTLEKNSPIIRLSLSFESLTGEPVEDVVYTMTGGSGLPIEGTWYTRYYLQMVGGMVPADGGYPYLEEQLSQQIAAGKSVEYSHTPLQYAGICNQYFASLIIQEPAADKERLIASAAPLDYDEGTAIEQPLHNISVRVISTPVTVRPGETASHDYFLFNGPKEKDLLAKYENYHLPLVVHYHNFLFLPVGTVARIMVSILEFFHSLVGDYGIAIILLTVLVRGCMFPLSYKQSTSMLKMQALQPQVQELKDKYGNDKERLNREMMELYRKANVNPVSGCLPMFIQLPIFVGLWQALSNSFSLRQSSFLYGLTWIHDLAAPDQLFKFPAEIVIPLVGFKFTYFNLLPVLAVIQMVLQARFLSPPATSPEMELQKKMMTFMMIFFGFLFYNVPAGLVVYIITSGAWSLAERLLLPKPQAPAAAALTPSKSSSSDKTPAWKAAAQAKKKRKSKR